MSTSVCTVTTLPTEPNESIGLCWKYHDSRMEGVVHGQGQTYFPTVQLNITCLRPPPDRRRQSRPPLEVLQNSTTEHECVQRVRIPVPGSLDELVHSRCSASIVVDMLDAVIATTANEMSACVAFLSLGQCSIWFYCRKPILELEHVALIIFVHHRSKQYTNGLFYPECCCFTVQIQATVIAAS